MVLVVERIRLWAMELKVRDFIPSHHFLKLANYRRVCSTSLGQGILTTLSPAPPRLAKATALRNSPKMGSLWTK